MKTSEAEARLRSMLRQAGFDFENPDLRLAWDTFKAFTHEAVEDIESEDDMVLFECGTDNFTGETQFSWGFVRQFSFDDEDGEYEHMEQLHSKFSCAPTDALSKLQATSWAEDFDSLDAYFTHVESLPEFQIPVQSRQDWTCEIHQGAV